jgi:ABC-2 type transport system permease protein
VSAFTGTGTLIRFILRRDRIRIPIWVVAIVFSVVGTALVLPDTFPTAADRQSRAELVDNPALSLILGPGYGLEDYTFGAMMSNEMLGITTIAVALMSIFMVVRHTRAEEEAGRIELVRSSVVGRYAGMTAALVVVTAVNIVIGSLVAIGLTSSLEELGLGGSLLFGVSLVATGVLFAAIAAVSAQVNEFARAASGLAGAVLAVTYVLRGLGDILDNFLSWLSPFGWALQTAPYVLDRWWPLALSLGLTALLVTLAYLFSDRRDVAAGMARPRPGPASASDRLTRPVGMVLRLQRGTLIGWAVGITVFAVAIGSIVSDITESYAENPVVQDYLRALGLDQAVLTDSILSMYISFFALFASIYTVSTVTRLRREETSQRAENVLATAVSRRRWAAESLVFGIVTSTVILLAAGLGTGIMYAFDSNDVGNVLPVVEASLAYAPVLWLAAGIALAVFGLMPRFMVLAWAVPVHGIFILWFGPLLGLPDWIYDTSPFEQVPRLPAAEFDLTPLLVMTAIAAAFMVAGLFGIRRRDLDFV